LRKNVVRPEKTDLDRKELQEVIEKDKSIPQEKKEELKKIDQELKKEDTKKIEQKEVELTKKEEEIKKTQEQIKQEEQKIQKELQDTNKKLEELRKDPEKNKEQIKQEEKKVEQLQEQKKEIQQQKQEVQQEQKKVEEAKQEIKEQKEQPQTTRKEEEKKENQDTTENQQKQPTSKVDQQLETLKKENEELKKEIEKKEQQSDNVINEKIVFLKVMRYVSDGHYSNELWMVDPNKDDTLFRGPFTNICSRTFLPIEKVGIVVIGYEDAAHTQTPHHLYLLDQDNLQVKAKSKEIVIFSSFLIYKDNLIYAIEELDGKYYLSRFNDKLELQDRSSSNINPHSEITFFKDKIYLTGSGTDSNIPIQIYNRKDLKLIKVIQPQKTSANK